MDEVGFTVELEMFGMGWGCEVGFIVKLEMDEVGFTVELEMLGGGGGVK